MTLSWGGGGDTVMGVGAAGREITSTVAVLKLLINSKSAKSTSQ